jgi:uncharacterized protein (TIGR03435 family)
MMLRTILVLSVGIAPAMPVFQSDAPTFEVASIRPNNSGENEMRFNYMAGRFTATNVTLRMLVRAAYNVQDSQVVGGPKWVTFDRFNILAKGDVGRSSAPMVIQPDGPSRLQLMMQALLVDRFKLVVHKEARESNVYALSIVRSDGRLGPALRGSDVDCAALAAQARQGGATTPAVLPALNPCALARGRVCVQVSTSRCSRTRNSMRSANRSAG